MKYQEIHSICSKWCNDTTLENLIVAEVEKLLLLQREACANQADITIKTGVITVNRDLIKQAILPLDKPLEKNEILEELINKIKDNIPLTKAQITYVGNALCKPNKSYYWIIEDLEKRFDKRITTLYQSYSDYEIELNNLNNSIK